jgi:hypothetical protein
MSLLSFMTVIAEADGSAALLVLVVLSLASAEFS